MSIRSRLTGGILLLSKGKIATPEPLIFPTALVSKVLSAIHSFIEQWKSAVRKLFRVTLLEAVFQNTFMPRKW